MCRFVLPVLFVAVIGCGDEPIVEPPPPPTLTGLWIGTADDELWPVRLTDQAGELSGTYSLNFPSEGSVSLTGSVTGTYLHPNATIRVDLIIPPAVFNCEYQAVTAVDVNTMSGSYSCLRFGQPTNMAQSLTLNRSG